jgi:Predicted transcriptional regulator
MLGPKPGSTREEILYLLKTHGPLSAGDIAEKLSISEMAVRRHLSTLERDRLVRAMLVRQTMGRPANLFLLTEKAEALFPKHYADFALDLLQDLVAEEGTEKMEALLARREARLREHYQPQMEGKPLRERVATLAALQNERGIWPTGTTRESGSSSPSAIAPSCGSLRSFCRCARANCGCFARSWPPT